MSLFQPIGMPNGVPDMTTMYPQGRPQTMMNSMPQGQPPVPVQMSPNQELPPQVPMDNVEMTSYTGHPLIDKYIRTFIS
jgi:hypothetical protein